MAQTKTGALKVAAKRLGVSVEILIEKQSSGLKWCRLCTSWKPVADFARDNSRHDRLCPVCNPCRYGTPSAADIPVADLPAIKLAMRRQRIRDAWVFRKPTFVPPLKGKKMDAGGRKRISEAMRGRPSKRRGVPRSPDERRAISKGLRGTTYRGRKHHSYKDGKIAERRGIRFSAAYKQWRYDVYLRDRFSCQQCGDNRGGNLNAHHVKSFADFPALRFDVSNGITLCEKCHKGIHHKPDSIRNLARQRAAERSSAKS